MLKALPRKKEILKQEYLESIQFLLQEKKILNTKDVKRKAHIDNLVKRIRKFSKLAGDTQPLITNVTPKEEQKLFAYLRRVIKSKRLLKGLKISEPK